jgi:predicted DsbA family dithiol-disulfide isomerase
MKKLRVDVWSDIVCPWCYVGKRRLEAAVAGFSHRDAVEIVWRAFELDPAAPRERDIGVPYAERLARKYRTSVAKAGAMIQHLTDVAAAEGLALRFDRARPGNTFDAHRLLHLAAERGEGPALQERLLAAYMTEGAPIGERETLIRLAGEVGLDTEEASAVLASDAYAADVRADESRAQAMGVTGVPFFVLGGRYAVSGAQPAELLRSALTEAWNDLAGRPDGGVPEGAVCGPEGCG